MGHISQQGLNELRNKGNLDEPKNAEIGFCENCIFGKAHKEFNKSIHITKGILDYVHADLRGPAKNVSLGGAPYFLSIIDEFSRRVVCICDQKEE